MVKLKRLDLVKATKLLTKAKKMGKKADNGKLEVTDDFAKEFNTFFDGIKDFSKELKAENEKLRQQIKGDTTVMEAKYKNTTKKWKTKLKKLNPLKKKTDKDFKEKQ